jgi:hypothetical protein
VPYVSSKAERTETEAEEKATVPTRCKVKEPFVDVNTLFRVPTTSEKKRERETEVDDRPAKKQKPNPENQTRSKPKSLPSFLSKQQHFKSLELFPKAQLTKK